MRHQVSTESIPPEPVLIENMTDLQLEVAEDKAREDLARAYGMRVAIIREREKRAQAKLLGDLRELGYDEQTLTRVGEELGS